MRPDQTVCTIDKPTGSYTVQRESVHDSFADVIVDWRFMIATTTANIEKYGCFAFSPYLA